MAVEKIKASILEKLVPVLLLASIVLAFIVGILWQRVSNIEKGTGSVTQPPSTDGQPQAPSKLDDLESIAAKLGIDEGEFKSCLDSQKYKDRVENDYQGGLAAGVRGTPGNFIANDSGEVWFIPGALPLEQIRPVVDLALGKGGADQPVEGIEKLPQEQASQLPSVSEQDHVKGERGAKVKLIEYSDYECPFCVRFHPTAQQVLDEYGNDLAWVYRHFPLDQIHPRARPAAEASECVAELGGEEAFWDFTDEVLGG